MGNEICYETSVNLRGTQSSSLHWFLSPLLLGLVKLLGKRVLDTCPNLVVGKWANE